MNTQKHVVVWHPYPEEEPKERGLYLVTRTALEPRKVDLLFYFGDGWGLADIFVKAWAELPPPYSPEEHEPEGERN